MITTKSIRHVLPFACILLIATVSNIFAKEVHESKILNHNIEIELF